MTLVNNYVDSQDKTSALLEDNPDLSRCLVGNR